jgi:hypothetical protein
MSERPRTTAERPERLSGEEEGQREGTVERRWITPAGVHGVKRGVAEREERFPMFKAWNLWWGKMLVGCPTYDPHPLV